MKTEPPTGWERWQSSFFEEAMTQTQRLASIPQLFQKIDKVQKGVTPREMVYDEDRLKLYRYLSPQPPRYKTPVCFVFALVNRPYIVDLKENRSVIAHFVNAGFPTYLIDWGTPTRAERFLTMDDYVNGYLHNVVNFLREQCEVDAVNLLGYCMGGTLSTMYTAIRPDLVRNLILLTTGIDFAARDGLISLWSDPRYLDVDKLVDTVGNVPAAFMQGGFLMLKPVQNLIEKQIHLLENIHNEKFVDDFMYMETWLNDNIPVPGEVYREFAKYLFQQNLLVKNRMRVGRHSVNLRKITCPLLNLMGKNDDLVPPCQSEPLNDLVGSTDKETIVWPAGHIGLAVGGKAQAELWPRVVQWLGERSEAIPSS
jgi:polyhydroxyalkanoate synthase